MPPMVNQGANHGNEGPLGVVRRNLGNAALPIIFLGAAAALIFAISNVLGDLREGEISAPEITLTVLLVIGVVVLLVTLAALVSLLAAHDLADKNQALGLPEGTVRAVVALVLLLVFSILSIFLYGDIAHGRTELAQGVSQAIVEALPADRIISIAARDQAGETVYDVTLRGGSETSDDLADRIITLVGTLVAALTAFYFGSQAVRSAAAAVAPIRATEPTVTVDSPTDVSLAVAQGTPLENIIVTVDPSGTALGWGIVGDDTGDLVQTTPGRFAYVRGAAAQNIVLLRFYPAEHPDRRAEVIVRPA
jgi:hypothetical protein